MLSNMATKPGYGLYVGSLTRTIAKRESYRRNSTNWYCFSVILCVCALFIPSNSNKVGYGEEKEQGFAMECDTPNQDKGFCVEIEQCTLLFQQLNNSKAAMFLNESRCDTREDSHKVCCGKYDNYNTVKESKIFPKSCGQQLETIASRIFGGNECGPGEFPWMGRLLYKHKDHSRTLDCAGFLINYRHVITAAHCIQHGENKELQSVVLGEHNTGTNKSCIENGTDCVSYRHVRKVVKTTVHPDYNPKKNLNDIALLQLKSGIRRSKFVHPICLTSNNKIIPNRYYVSGWGKTEKVLVSGKKMKVSLPPFDRNECKKKYNMTIITESQICAGGEDGKDTCVGDSGGPLMISDENRIWYAAGIVSYGMICGTKGWPGVYTNIEYYLPWIRDEIAKNILSLKRTVGRKRPIKKKKVTN